VLEVHLKVEVLGLQVEVALTLLKFEPIFLPLLWP
jgi:hypothetical protein